jgi:16S rRNA (cytosine1402-N4)-methyltransferase
MSIKPRQTHISVLPHEVIEYLDPQPGKTYLDVTFGAGGHTRAILEHEPECTVIALDWDNDALEKFGRPLEEEFGDRIHFIWGNFAHLYRLLKKEKITSVDGILADFGTSQGQLAGKAGFSFHIDSPLDMRMSPAHQKVTAAELLNKSTEAKLADIFFEYGGERQAKKIARLIVAERKVKRFKTTRQLAQLIERIIPKTGRIHPATKVFQAIRIYINSEIDNIRSFLPAALDVLAPGGRIVCISFHSLEDQKVKSFFLEKEREGLLQLLTKKPVAPTEEEMQDNPSSRSAKLRAAIRL